MSLNPAHSNVMRKYQKEKQLESSILRALYHRRGVYLGLLRFHV